MRKIIYIFLSFVMVFAPAVSFAASPVGWSVSPLDILMNGATATITAVKGTGASALQSTIKHTPTVVNVGKKLIKGTGYVAVGLAVTQLVGDSVDWVLDPANNSIRYTKSSSVDGVCNNNNVAYPSIMAAGSAICSKAGRGSAKSFAPISYDPSKFFVTCSDNKIMALSCTGFVPAPSEPKYIPISTVAEKVIANAASGDVASQDAVKAAAIDDFNSGLLDVPLNVAAVPVADTPPLPVDPDAPPLPFDPSSIIAAIKSVMAAVVNMSGVLGAKIDALMIDLGLKHEEKLAADAVNSDNIVKSNDRTTEKIDDIFNSDTPPEKPKNETDVPIDDLPPTGKASDYDVNYINFGGQCPSLPSVNIGILSASSSLTFDMTPLCDMAIKIRPAIVAIAYFIGLGVIASAIRET